MSSSVSKSYHGSDPVKEYCLSHSTPLHPVQKKLQEETVTMRSGGMLGAPEVLSLNSLLIRSLGAKKVLDIGVFTGASALAAALALPEDGKVLACDVNKEWTDRAQEYWQQAGVSHKIDLKLAPASETLQAVLDKGDTAGTYDFAFIDADKPGYSTYFELGLQLLRKGGIMSFDNTLWSGAVLDESDKSVDTLALKALNDKLAADDRVFVVQINIGDGLTLVTKK